MYPAPKPPAPWRIRFASSGSEARSWVIERRMGQGVYAGVWIGLSGARTIEHFAKMSDHYANNPSPFRLWWQG